MIPVASRAVPAGATAWDAGHGRVVPATYCDRLAAEIVPELLTEAAIAMATAELERSNALLKTRVLR